MAHSTLSASLSPFDYEIHPDYAVPENLARDARSTGDIAAPARLFVDGRLSEGARLTGVLILGAIQDTGNFPRQRELSEWLGASSSQTARFVRQLCDAGVIVRKRKRRTSNPRAAIALSSVRARVWEKTEGSCYYCGGRMNPFEDFSVDHVVPISRGGSNDLCNLVPACRRCNSRKGNR